MVWSFFKKCNEANVTGVILSKEHLPKLRLYLEPRTSLVCKTWKPTNGETKPNIEIGESNTDDRTRIDKLPVIQQKQARELNISPNASSAVSLDPV